MQCMWSCEKQLVASANDPSDLREPDHHCRVPQFTNTAIEEEHASTPLRTGALSQCLRPLGQTALRSMPFWTIVWHKFCRSLTDTTQCSIEDVASSEELKPLHVSSSVWTSCRESRLTCHHAWSKTAAVIVCKLNLHLCCEPNDDFDSLQCWFVACTFPKMQARNHLHVFWISRWCKDTDHTTHGLMV